MARNTLEAVFGALGAGLTGYGRERREKQEAEERRKRESDLMRVQMLGMGFEPEGGESTRRSQRLAQAGQLAQAGSQMPRSPGMPNMSVIGRALSQASQDVPLGRSITVGGERFVQPLSQMPEALARRRAEEEERRTIRAEERALKDFETQEDIRAKFRQTPERDDWVWSDTRGALINKKTGQVRVPEGLPDRPTTGGGAEGEQAIWRAKLPRAAQNRLEQAESSIDLLQDLRTGIANNPNAVGAKNYAWGAVVDRIDPSGTNVRAMIELIAGDIRNARFGGQLTKQEAELAMRALPDATQRADILLSRIDALEDFLEGRRLGVYRSYGRQDEYSKLYGSDSTQESAADRLRSGRYD